MEENGIDGSFVEGLKFLYEEGIDESDINVQYSIVGMRNVGKSD